MPLAEPSLCRISEPTDLCQGGGVPVGAGVTSCRVETLARDRQTGRSTDQEARKQTQAPQSLTPWLWGCFKSVAQGLTCHSVELGLLLGPLEKDEVRVSTAFIILVPGVLTCPYSQERRSQQRQNP